MERELFVEAVQLGDIYMLEDEIVPCTGCGCECNPAPAPAPAPAPSPGDGGDGGI